MSGLPDYGEALRRALHGISAIGESESVGLEAAAGRVLRDPVVADRDLPPLDRARMDGYALRADDLAAAESFPVAATIAAGQAAEGIEVPQGHCVAIATGAPDSLWGFAVKRRIPSHSHTGRHCT